MRKPFLIFRSYGMKHLFQYAKTAYERGNLFSALIIFDYLARTKPLLAPHYLIWVRKCVRRIRNLSGTPPRLNTTKHTKRGITVRLMDTLISLGYPTEELVNAMDMIPEASNRALLKASLFAGNDTSQWELHLNQYLESHDLRSFRLMDHVPGKNVLECLSFDGNPQWEDVGMVTVFISAYNSVSTIRYAIESVLRQDYQNFELLIADDCSTDGTKKIIAEYADKDPRVTPIFNTTNLGTYWNRNVALQKAKGTYFTILDADDLCHPQRIAMQIQRMREDPEIAGVFSHWLRLEDSGRLVFRNWGASYLHEAIATLLIHREKVVPRIGYYDQVRFSADTEYVHRIKRVFGSNSIKVIRKPLTLALAHATSLTAEQTNGIHNYLGLSKPRRDYRNAWNNWHANTDAAGLYIDFPAGERKFPAPEVMLISRR